MEGIKDKVAIVGMGCTQFGELWDKNHKDLVIDACYEAFEDAGIEPKDIQAAWYGSRETGFTGTQLASALKLEYIPITRVENFCAGGTDTFRNACYAVASGVCDIALAVGVEKCKDHQGGFNMDILDPFDRSMVEWELPPASQFALLATRYMHHYGWKYEDFKRILSMIDVKNHHNGTISPKAQFHREITIEQAMNAPMISYPLGLFDACGVSDGSAAAIVTTPEIAKKMRKDYILVKALALTNGAGQAVMQPEYNFISIPETVKAAEHAYKEAGITTPRDEVDMAIVHDCFSITELMTYEDLQFSPRGKASEDVEAGTFTLEGELPVNTDGGLKCFGHPLSASGLRMIYEVYKQMQGKAGPRQLKKVDIGLTHNVGGICGFFNCTVALFGKP
jgi:acetyl-CoA C-acetyltransferase